jgi:ZIP family zinc transporter
MTCLGAGVVLFFKNEISLKAQKIFLGFAAGVMIAASVWGLLTPAIAEAEARGDIGWIPAAGGFLIGIAFMYLLDILIPHIHPDTGEYEGLPSRSKRSTLLVLAVTIHNIPEGLAVGITFALAAQHGGGTEAYMAAAALALGIGIQNFPEGAVVSLPLRRDGMSRGKAFALGALSGIMEPIFAFVAVAISGALVPIMPWTLAFAAGAMMYVVVEELIPEAHLGEHSNYGTLSVLGGFTLMMILDVSLG